MRYCLLALLVTAALVLQECSPLPRPAARPDTSTACGPPLAVTDVVASAKRALRVMWGHEPVLDHYHVSVQSQGCDYVFVASHPGTEALESIVIVIDRAGRVRTIPVCCDLGDCPEYCAPSKHAPRYQVDSSWSARRPPASSES